MSTYVYIVVDQEGGAYESMTFLSASTLRATTKESCRVIVIVPSHDLSRMEKGLIAKVADNIIGVDCASFPKLAQSRYLKTMVRDVVLGDYVFLDADTLVFRDPASIWGGVVNVGLVEDIAIGKSKPGFPLAFAELFARLGWRRTRHYYNSGVMAVRDNIATRVLFSRWKESWLEAWERQGCVFDQPAFNYSLESCGITVSALASKYNALVDAKPHLARGAHIVHFYTKNGRPSVGTLADQLLSHFEATHEVRWSALRNARRMGHPWALTAEPWMLFRSRNYFAACWEKVRRLGIRAR